MDGQVPAARRALPPFSRPAAGSGPADLGGTAARVPELSALLDEIDALRTTLSTDLSLAAAALEVGAEDLAGELVDGDLFAVRAFASRATGHLAALNAGDSAQDQEPAVDAVVSLGRLARLGAPDEELRQAAEQLNHELAALVAQAAQDPAAAQEALVLLETSTEVLSSRQGNSSLLHGVMAEAQALRAQLRAALPVLAHAPLPRTTVLPRF